MPHGLSLFLSSTRVTKPYFISKSQRMGGGHISKIQAKAISQILPFLFFETYLQISYYQLSLHHLGSTEYLNMTHVDSI